MTTTPWDEARRRAHAASPLTPVRTPLADAVGSTLAEPLVVATAIPAFDTAAMDGYAVAGAGPWQVTGRVLAGSPAPPDLAPGCAVEIATGAAVPAGATAVLPYEAARRTAELVEGLLEPVTAAACFIPRHGVRAGRQGAELELVICFECNQARVYPEGWTTISDRPRAIIGQLLQAAGIPLSPV